MDGYDDYYPFGLTMPGRSSNSANPNDNYKFTGYEHDDEANLTLDYMMARNYDPMIARFMQIDPLMEFASPYVYVGNNPLIFTDPTGMFSCREGESQGDCNQRYGEEKQAEWDAIDAGADISDVWGANSILNNTSSNREQVGIQNSKPNYHNLSDNERALTILNSIVMAAEAGKTNLDVNDIFDFFNNTFGKNYGPGPDGMGGTTRILAKEIEFGSFKGNIQIFFATTFDKVNDTNYSSFNINKVGYPKSRDYQLKVDGDGKVVKPNVRTKYRYATFEASASYVFRIRVLTGSQQKFYDSLIRPLQKIGN